MLDNEIILVGYSGHGFVVAEAAESMGLHLKYYSERNELDANPYQLEYLGFEGSESFKGWSMNAGFIVGIGDNHIREKVSKLILSKNKSLLNTIHITSLVARNAKLGSGNFIARNVSVNPLVEIGNFCILNTGCIVEHECIVKDSAHIAPGAVLAGNVEVGERTFIGSNAVVKQGVKIGNDVIVGAGSVVLRDIPDHKKVVGNPSREI